MDTKEVRELIWRCPVDGSVAAMRDGFAVLADLPLESDGATLERRVSRDLYTLRVSDGRIDEDAPPIVYLHGGGYVLGSPDTHARAALVLSRAAGATLLLPAYPLAPEHPWPAQRDALLDWLDHLDAPGGYFLAGDSAGGHLALSLALALAESRRARLHGLVLFSPNTLRDYARSESRLEREPLDAMNAHGQDDALARLAFGETRGDDLDQNPLDRDLSALPPVYLDVGTHEILLDDALLFARRAALAGVALDLHVAPGMFHLRQLFAQHWRAADASLERAGLWVRERLAEETDGDGD